MFKQIAVGIVGTSLLLTACSASTGGGSPSGSPTPTPTSTSTSVDPTAAAAITKLIETSMAEDGLQAVIVQVRRDGQPIIRQAFGESMTGVPATPEMHFRNGAVAISYMANLMLQYVDSGQANLNDLISKWVPDVPHADKITLRQLAQMTSGYQDYVQDEGVRNEIESNPFGFMTTERQLQAGAAKPLSYEPGTNWSYAHTNYVVLGLILEKIGGQPLATLIQDKVLKPLRLNSTLGSDTAEIPQPQLHAFDAERKTTLKIPPSVSFIEESSFWSPSWTLAHGAIETSTIDDMSATAEAIGTGKLLSENSFKEMTSTSLRGFGHSQPGCPTCVQQTEAYTYGIGLPITGDWFMQNPSLAGYAGVEAYLPQEKVSIAIEVTLNVKGFSPEGGAPNNAQALFREIGAIVSPAHSPPVPAAR